MADLPFDIVRCVVDRYISWCWWWPKVSVAKRTVVWYIIVRWCTVDPCWCRKDGACENAAHCGDSHLLGDTQVLCAKQKCQCGIVLIFWLLTSSNLSLIDRYRCVDWSDNVMRLQLKLDGSSSIFFLLDSAGEANNYQMCITKRGIWLEFYTVNLLWFLNYNTLLYLCI